MKILLDSHAFVWLVFGNPRFSRRARLAVEDAESVHLSAVTGWELATKVRIGKWPEAEALSRDLPKVILEFGLRTVSVTMDHARQAGSMPGAHKDPFDRMLAAQAIIEGMGLVTADRAFVDFGTRTIW